MDPRIAARFNDGMLRRALAFYAALGPAEALDGFESFIYRFTCADGDRILRLGHSGRRSPAAIAGEVDWINHLARGGAGVARAVLSENGRLVEAIDDGHGERFLATAFVRAPGGRLPKRDWAPAFVRHYGAVIGRIHALSKGYAPADPAWRRGDWDAPANLDVERGLGEDDAAVRARFAEVLDRLRALPTDSGSYGMIHQDAHAGNFHVHDGRITLFDFDDCVYGHFVYDIAMVLFYAANGEEDPAAFAAAFMPDFLRGYAGENELEPRWLEALPHFMKLREIDLYAQINFSFDPNEDNGPWIRDYMDGRKERIEAGRPYIDFAWNLLAAGL